MYVLCMGVFFLGGGGKRKCVRHVPVTIPPCKKNKFKGHLNKEILRNFKDFKRIFQVFKGMLNSA